MSRKRAATARKALASAAYQTTVAQGDCAASGLRGVLPAPPEVERLVARELKDHPVTDAERQRITDCFSLQYYFGGEEVAYRHTPAGVEILAVGLEEIGQMLRRVPASERDGIIVGHPDPW